MFAVGQFLRFDYPRANYNGVKLSFEVRSVQVLCVRDTFERPLLAATINADPLKLRGQFLYTCLDLDDGREKMFWDCSMNDVREIAAPTFGENETPPQLMAVVDPEAGRVVARAMSPAMAEGFARGWSRRHGMACTVTEPIILPSDDQVLEQLR